MASLRHTAKSTNRLKKCQYEGPAGRSEAHLCTRPFAVRASIPRDRLGGSTPLSKLIVRPFALSCTEICRVGAVGRGRDGTGCTCRRRILINLRTYSTKVRRRGHAQCCRATVMGQRSTVQLVCVVVMWVEGSGMRIRIAWDRRSARGSSSSSGHRVTLCASPRPRLWWRRESELARSAHCSNLLCRRPFRAGYLPYYPAIMDAGWQERYFATQVH